MTPKQTIRFLASETKRLNAERKRLRALLELTADCINATAHGHTPDWHRLLKRIEAYEDSYAPLGDED